MCLFFFLLCEKKFTSRKKKVADAAQRSFSENQIVGGKEIWMRDCWWSSVWQSVVFVMHFLFDQYYYQCKKKKTEKNLRDLLNCSHESGILRPRWDLFVSLPLVHRSVRAVVLFLVFSEERMSLLNQVVWARACVRLNKPAPWWADFDPISNICPLTLVERMPSYANFYTGSVEPF